MEMKTETIEEKIETKPNGEDKAVSAKFFGIDATEISTWKGKFFSAVDWLNKKFDSLDSDLQTKGLLIVAIVAAVVLGRWATLVFAAALAIRTLKTY